MTTIAPYRSPAPAGDDGFRQLAHAEWTKFRTVRGWVIGMIVAFLVTGGLGVFAAEASSQISCGEATSTGGGSFHQVSVQHGAACTTPLTLGPGGEAVTDSFYFVHQPLTGNGSITVRVASLAAAGSGPVPAGGQPDVPQSLVPWSKAGVIIKDGTTSGSGYAAMMVTGGHGVRMQWSYTGDTAGLAGTVSTARARWLRLTRSGSTITGYDSADGVRWTQVGVVNLAGLPSTVQAGLFAASPRYSQTSTSFGGGDENGGPTQDTAVFDHVVRSGGWAAGPWAGSYVGRAAALAQGGPTGGYHQAGGRFTVTGSGDIAPAIGGPLNSAAGHPTVTIFLIGTFAGLIAVIVVAAMFMTAEYRRGLIRTTLAASPRRARVLAAKALVLGLAAFVAGVAGAAAAVLIGRAIVGGQGLDALDAESNRTDGYRRMLAAVADGSAAKADSPDEALALAGWLAQTGADARAIGYLLDSSVATQWDALAQVPTPTLVVVGEADSRGASAGELAALLPYGRLAVVPGDHVTAPSAPEFTDAVANFLG